jgi:hypothetical protein
VNSGTDGQWRKGPTDWTGYLPVQATRIYYVDGFIHTTGWDDAPLFGVAGVLLLQGGRFKTWITGYDEYCIEGSGKTLLGGQIGEVDCAEWEVFYAAMIADGEKQ